MASHFSSLKPDQQVVQNLGELNEDFLRSVEEIRSRPVDEQPLLDDSIRAFKRHRSDIQSALEEKESAPPPPPPAPKPPTPALSFSMPFAPPAAAKPLFGAAAEPSGPPPLAFAAPAAPAAAQAAAPAPAPFSFGLPPAAGGFSFGTLGGGGSGAAPAAAAPSPFVFNLGRAAGAPAGASPFAFSTGAPPAPFLAHAAAEEGEDEPERPPSPSVVKGSSDDDVEDIKAQANAKIFFKESAGKKVEAPDALRELKWADCGKGVLHVRVEKQAGPSGEKVARLVMRNDTGKLMLNARLYAALTVTMQKASLVMNLINAIEVARLPPAPGAPVPAAAEPEPPKLQLTMLRFASEETAKKVKAAIETSLPSK